MLAKLLSKQNIFYFPDKGGGGGGGRGRVLPESSIFILCYEQGGIEQLLYTRQGQLLSFLWYWQVTCVRTYQAYTPPVTPNNQTTLYQRWFDAGPPSTVDGEYRLCAYMTKWFQRIEWLLFLESINSGTLSFVNYCKSPILYSNIRTTPCQHLL